MEFSEEQKLEKLRKARETQTNRPAMLATHIELWITKSNRELKPIFTPKISKRQWFPGCDVSFELNGLIISDYALTAIIHAHLMSMGMSYTLSMIKSVLINFCWPEYEAFVEAGGIPDWIKAQLTVKAKRPRGRPRIHPLTVNNQASGE